MRILRPLFHLAVVALIVFLLYVYVIFPFFTVKAQVIHLIDADTLMVKADGKVKKVQLIGVDAPDVAAGGFGEECLSWQARKVAANLFAENREVSLEQDDKVGDTDPHLRLLRYVRLADGRLMNEALLAEGMARVYDTDFNQREAFEALERAARAEGRGIWESCE